MVTDNKQPILTNTFLEGMDTDTSDALLKSSKYRLAKNVRLVTNTDSNTGELHKIEGVSTALEIDNGTIVASTSVRDIGVYVIKGEDSSKPKEWSIYTIKQDGTKSKVFGPCSEELGEYELGVDNKLSLVTRYEAENNIKLYIADGKHRIMSFDIHDGANNLNRNPSLNNSCVLPIIEFKNYTSGILLSGVVQYSCRFYNKYGDSSLMSHVSKLINIGCDTKGWYGIGNELEEKNNCGVHLQIDISKCTISNYERYIVYRVYYTQLGQTPTVSIIQDSTIPDISTKNYIDLYDNGGSAVSLITIEEFNSITGIQIIPKQIESKNNYLFASNVKYIGAFEENKEAFNDWDARAYRFKKCENDVYSCKLYNYSNLEGDAEDFTYTLLVSSDSEYKVPLDHDCYQPHNNINTPWFIVDKEYMYNVNGNIGGSGINVSWEFVNTTNTLDEIKQASDYYYTDRIESLDSFEYKKSLYRDELYRYGIIMYDEYGFASPVKWIADIRVPHASYKLNDEEDYNPYTFDANKTTGNKTLMSNELGIEFSVSNLPQFCKQYEIVRVPRTIDDKATITLGVLSKPMISLTDDGITSGAPYIPTGFLTTDDITIRIGNSTKYTSNSLTDNLFQFVSPETTYDSERLNLYLKGLNIRLEFINYSWTVSDENHYLNNVSVSKCINDNQVLIKPGNFNEVYFGQKYENYEYSYNINGRSYDNLHYGDLIKREYLYGKLYERLYTINNSLHGTNINIHQWLRKIDDFVIANEFNWSDFYEGNGGLKYLYDIVPIGTLLYTNWVGGALSDREYDTYAKPIYTGTKITTESVTVPMGPGGRCFLFKLDETEGNNGFLNVHHKINKNVNGESTEVIPFGTYVCNVRKDTIPYYGYDYNSRLLNTYYSSGNVCSSTENSIKVYDGDCYLFPLEYVSMHKCYMLSMEYNITTSICYSIPLESSINLQFANGINFSKNIKTNKSYSNVQMLPANVNNVFTQNIPLYRYNDIYNTDPTIKAHSSITEDYLETQKQKFDYRVCYSELKSNNEYEDSWLKFQSANYIDVDEKYGPITDLRTFKNQLIFWLENATGILSVNERLIIQDKSNLPLILGTGGALDRYDYITTSNGMRENQFADAQSDAALYWWDANKKEICSYIGGLSCVKLSKVKSVLNLINSYNIDSSPNIAYDFKYNEVLFSILLTQSGQNLIGTTLVYNEQIQAFTSLYDSAFDCSMKFTDKLYLVNGDIYEWNKRSTSPSPEGTNGYMPAYVKYVINEQPYGVKVFDNIEFNGDVDTTKLNFTFTTSNNQSGSIANGNGITVREGEYRFAIPRDNNANYGERLKGKTMQCELTSSSGDFSLQYINTKYRMS